MAWKYPQREGLVGYRFGRYVVTAFAGHRGGHQSAIYEVRCDCGEVRTVLRCTLIAGTATSCGCAVREKWRAQGDRHTRAPEFMTWQSMIARCHSPGVANYYLYGGTGISVCDRWRNDFQAFLADMGRRPTRRHSIDRIDPHGNYEPGNCRWATPTEQARNRRDTIMLTVDGVTKPMATWADETGINANAMAARLRRGWSHERIVKTPMLQYKPRSGA